MFEPDPVEGETYPLGRDEIDLEPALREALALALPLAPLCDEDCSGPDPDAHPVTTAPDEAEPSDGDDLPGRPPLGCARRPPVRHQLTGSSDPTDGRGSTVPGGGR